MTVAYLDSSAFVKLVVVEVESAALRAWLEAWPEQISSQLLRAEAMRAVGREQASALLGVREALGLMYLAPITETLLDMAGRLGPPAVRTLAAIHLATALSMGATLGALVTYDRRMIEAAEHLGLPVASPA